MTVRYSFMPFHHVQTTNYTAPFYYLMADEVGYFFSRTGKTDSVDISIDVPDFLFYFRSDMQFDRDRVDSDVRRISTTTDSIPSLFVLYKPAFLNAQDTLKDIKLDLLWEHIDKEHSVFAEKMKLVLYPLDYREPADSAMSYLHNMLTLIYDIGSAVGEAPSKIEIIVANMFHEWGGLRYTYGRAYLSDGQGLVLIDPEDYYSRVLPHELFHLFLPSDDELSWVTPYEHYLVSEAFAEYFADIVYNKCSKEDIFLGKKQSIEENNYSAELAKKVARKSKNSYNGEIESSSMWLYYTFIPYHLHNKAQSSFKDGDEGMVNELVSFLEKCKTYQWEEQKVRPLLNQLKDELDINY